MQSPHRGLTLVDLLGLVVAAGLLTTLGLPTAARIRELSKRSVCKINLKSIGQTSLSYSADNGGMWMIPPFSDAAIDEEGIDYLKNSETVHPFLEEKDPGAVGWDRRFPSQTDAEFGGAGSTAVSTTRAFWLLVRSGDVAPQQFTCPSSYDEPDETENAELYYDFRLYSNVSYGYRVPFSPEAIRPQSSLDPRVAAAADKGPIYVQDNCPEFTCYVRPHQVEFVGADSPRRCWELHNSPNHSREGQNVLFFDGSARFSSNPIAGVTNDNIYTVMQDNWSADGDYNLLHGDSPHCTPRPNPYPGQEAFMPIPAGFSSTDSLIYP